MGKQWKHWQILFSWGPKSLQMVTAAIKLKDVCSLEKSSDKPRQHIKKQRHYFADKCPYTLCHGLSSSHVWMWELDHKGLQPKNWCFPTVVMEKTLESTLDTRVIKPVNPKGNQPEYSLEGLMLKLKLQYFGHLMWRADALEKSLMLGKIEGKRRRGQRMRCLDSITGSMDMNLSQLQETMKDREVWCTVDYGVAKSQTRLSK